MKQLFTYILISLTLPLSAQYSDSTFYHIKLVANGSLNKTNNGDAYLLNNALNFGVKKERTTLNFSNSWLFGKQNGRLTNNDVNSALNFNLYRTFPHFYYWGLANYTSSHSLKINHQMQAGLGIAYDLFDTETFYINLSNGILFETSNLLADNRYDTYRNSFRLQYRWQFKELFVFEGNNFLQNSLARSDDFIIRSTNKLAFKLNNWMSLNTALIYNRMNFTRSENLNLTYGLTIDHYF